MRLFALTFLALASGVNFASGVALKGSARQPADTGGDSEHYSIAGSTVEGYPRAAFTRALPRLNGNYLSAQHSGYGPSDYMERAKAEFQQPTINTVAGQEYGHPQPPSDPPEPPPFKPRPFHVYTSDRASATTLKGHLKEGSVDYSGPPSMTDFQRIKQLEPKVQWVFPAFGPMSGGQAVLVGVQDVARSDGDIVAVTVAGVKCLNPTLATSTDFFQIAEAALRKDFAPTADRLQAAAVTDNLAATHICCVQDDEAEAPAGSEAQCAAAPRAGTCPSGFRKVRDEFSFPGEWLATRASRPACCLNAVQAHATPDASLRGEEFAAAELAVRGATSPAVADIDYFAGFSVKPGVGAVPCVVDLCTSSAFAEVDAAGAPLHEAANRQAALDLAATLERRAKALAANALNGAVGGALDAAQDVVQHPATGVLAAALGLFPSSGEAGAAAAPGDSAADAEADALAPELIGRRQDMLEALRAREAAAKAAKDDPDAADAAPAAADSVQEGAESDQRRLLDFGLLASVHASDDGHGGQDAAAVVVRPREDGNIVFDAVPVDARPSWWSPLSVPSPRVIRCTTGSGTPTGGLPGPVGVTSTAGIAPPSQAQYVYLKAGEFKDREAKESVSMEQLQRMADAFQ